MENFLNFHFQLQHLGIACLGLVLIPFVYMEKDFLAPHVLKGLKSENNPNYLRPVSAPPPGSVPGFVWPPITAVPKPLQ